MSGCSKHCLFAQENNTGWCSYCIRYIPVDSAPSASTCALVLEAAFSKTRLKSGQNRKAGKGDKTLIPSDP